MQSEQLSGVWNAIVTDNKDPEKLGRVKVKFPLREGELQTDWIRVATLMGGNDMGSLFLPEVGDEVLIAFLMGRLDQPIMIGSLWSKKKKPPAPHEKNDIRKIKTRSGHEITFDDADNAGSITIKTTKGHTIKLDDQGKTITLETQDKQQSLKLDETGKKVTAKAGTSTLEMTAQGDVKLTGTKSVTVKGAQVKVEADASLTLQSNGMLEVKANGVLSLKGSMVKIN
ncbi:phage baseplate assembly protein V [Paenibacillus sp. IB182493]|uniref:Phage baseplate assembly protein V n=2 Tax=Paenibacillus arenilitoris TaxID=2772299 RepID=A0A927CHF1_9BACL|nr:phage baseplate assembly protein V [Paenibacillus arenilitoris]